SEATRYARGVPRGDRARSRLHHARRMRETWREDEQIDLWRICRFDSYPAWAVGCRRSVLLRVAVGAPPPFVAGSVTARSREAAEDSFVNGRAIGRMTLRGSCRLQHSGTGPRRAERPRPAAAQ